VGAAVEVGTGEEDRKVPVATGRRVTVDGRIVSVAGGTALAAE
jgi:hypothetical protein